MAYSLFLPKKLQSGVHAQIDIKPILWFIRIQIQSVYFLDGFKFAEEDKHLRHLHETKIEAQRELEALTQALKVDQQLLATA